MATIVTLFSEAPDCADWNLVGQSPCLAKCPHQWQGLGAGVRGGRYLISVCVVRAADSLCDVILTSGLYVDADVTAALNTQDIVNGLF